MKRPHLGPVVDELKSRPVRGAWIETYLCLCCRLGNCCRAPCGARGLKLRSYDTMAAVDSRAPCGARGLKRLMDGDGVGADLVAPRAGRVD